jgi:hypothetical protein
LDKIVHIVGIYFPVKYRSSRGKRMQKLDGNSLDIVKQNVEKLKEIFPEVFSEGKIDFEKLENELGEFKTQEKERYNFTWHGKQKLYTRVVFKDKSFKDSVAKTNAMQILKQNGIDEVVSV